MNIYDEFREWAEAQELFDASGCVCGGRAPMDCQGTPADDVHHEPYCPVPRFLEVMWEASKRDAKVDAFFRIAGFVS